MGDVDSFFVLSCAAVVEGDTWSFALPDSGATAGSTFAPQHAALGEGALTRCRWIRWKVCRSASSTVGGMSRKSGLLTRSGEAVLRRRRRPFGQGSSSLHVDIRMPAGVLDASLHGSSAHLQKAFARSVGCQNHLLVPNYITSLEFIFVALGCLP